MPDISLRDYQAHMLSEVRTAYAQGFRAPLLVAPTGSGKTVCFSYVAANARAKGNCTLILVHRRELLEQTSRTLDAFGVEHGRIAAGEPQTDAAVQIASVQTLVRRLERMTWAPDLIVVDEAHHTTASTGHGRIIAAFPKARVLGVTATPERLDGQGLGTHVGGYFDRLVLGPSVADLIQRGYLSKPIVYAPAQALDLKGIATRAGDYAQDALAAAMDRPSITGSAVAEYRRRCEGAPAIAFCVTVEHARNVAAAFTQAGYKAASIDGTLSAEDRAKRIADLASGRLHVLTSCEIISEGTDIPIVGAAILLRPTQSLALYLQQVGRALRPYSGKERAVILDHVANSLRHGLPDDARDWNLDAKPRRQRAKDDDKPQQAVRQCDHCQAVHAPAPTCPECGHVHPIQQREIEHIDGELQEVTRQQADRLAQRRREQAKAQTLDDLRAIGRRRGYRPGWAEHVFKSRQQRQTAYHR
ncbi:DEAD/DEAH box helicase [Thiohalocapsa marina]|uniref:DEAD/DEAH box helicase n=1 Tax=Thiohalocapsa marina TaxID=424902 RepID=UPI0036DAF271